MVVEDGHGYASIFRGEYVEVLAEDLCEGRAGSGLIVDDQNGRFMIGYVGSGSRRHSVTCIVILATGQGNRVNTEGCTGV